MTLVLVFRPSFAEQDATGVIRVIRENGVYTLENRDGSKLSATLTKPDDSNVISIISAIRASNLSDGHRALPTVAFLDVSSPVSGVKIPVDITLGQLGLALD